MDMYFETPSMLTPLLTNFVATIFASNHAYTLEYTLLSRYEYFYIAIMIVNFILIYQYISISCISLITKYDFTPVRSSVISSSNKTRFIEQVLAYQGRLHARFELNYASHSRDMSLCPFS